MCKMRLQKFLSHAGIASRRKAEELIAQGRVCVNGVRIKDMGVKVSSGDVVEVDGKKVNLEEKKVYIMLNKPVGYISSAKDQFGRKTVLDLVKDVKERIYPVGRLDYDTSGLILLTNDGEFAYVLTHPSSEIDKVYSVVVKGAVSKDKIKAFKKGIKIDNYITSPAKLRIINITDNTSTVEITIHEGKNRQVRKMCKAIGHPVLKLKRIAIGPLKLGDLEEGKWRHLTEQEVKALKNYAKPV
ncbi:MAG TPA: rRNA pseudouridine synthase [Clostridiaceae bacterium]|nr:rRNA pseudouridine synthase [Clostridiaceae bacterium]